MSHPSLQDGSAGDPNASSQSQILLHIKKLLTETRVCLDALDRSTLAGLRFDEEYKDAVGHLLSPLTTIPLSNVVNKALTSAMKTLNDQLGSLLPSLNIGAAQDGKGSVDLATTAGPSYPDTAKPGKQSDPTSSRYQTKLKRGKNSSVSLTQPPRVGFGSATAPQPLPVVPQLNQISTEMSPLQEIRRNRRMMATIYFIKGGKRDTVTMPFLVEEMNKAMLVIAAGGVSYVWETVRGEIVIAFRVPQTDIARKAADAILAQLAYLWSADSSAYLRFGGDNPIHVLELEVVSGGSRQFYWATVVKEIEQEFKAMYTHDGQSSTRTSISLSFLAGMTWSKRWMLCEGYGSDIQRLVAEKWPRSYKKMVRYRSIDVEIEISMNLLCIADKFDFRA